MDLFDPLPRQLCTHADLELPASDSASESPSSESASDGAPAVLDSPIEEEIIFPSDLEPPRCI
jgi:hypothetical protein